VCTFETKIVGFLKGAFYVSAFRDMNKKIFDFFDFCFLLWAFLTENHPENRHLLRI